MPRLADRSGGQPASEGHAEEGNWASCEVVGIWDPPRVRVLCSWLSIILGATSASRPGHGVWVHTRRRSESVMSMVCGIQQLQRNYRCTYVLCLIG